MKQRPGDKKIFPRLTELVQELLSPDMISGYYDLFPASQGHRKNRGFTTTNLLFFFSTSNPIFLSFLETTPIFLKATDPPKTQEFSSP